MKNKKGIALNQAFGAVLTLVLVAVLVIVAIVIFASLSTSFVNQETRGIIAESLLAVNETGSSTVNASLCSFGSFAVSSANNASQAGIIITPVNYTVNAETGTIRLADGGDAGVNNTVWSINGSYNWGSPACTSSNAMITQFATYPVLVGLVGTIIFLGLVIGVLVASFVFGKGSGV